MKKIPLDEDYIVKAYGDCQNATAIAREFDVDQKLILNVLHKHHVPVRRCGTYLRTSVDLEKMSKTTLRYWKDNPGKKRHVQPNGSRSTFVPVKECIAMYESGLSALQVSERLGVSRSTILKHLRAAGIGIRGGEASRFKKTHGKSSGPEYAILMRCRQHALKRGLEFNIDVHDIVIPSSCPVFGMPLVRVHKKGQNFGPWTPSIDRFDSSRGYVKGNVWIISLLANRLKSNATLEQLRMLVAAMERQHAMSEALEEGYATRPKLSAAA